MMNRRELEREIAACTARTSARAARAAGDLVKINNELGILIHTGDPGVFGITWYALMRSGKIEHWHGCDLEVINESR
jgi:hypothetical protein